MAETATHGRVASVIPGRVRVRLDGQSHAPQHARHVKNRLEEHRGVGRVEIRQNGHSVVVHYDPRERSQSDVLAMLRDVGVILRDVEAAGGNELPDVGAQTGTESSTTAVSIIGALNDVDCRLSRLTGRRLDLKLLFPLTMGALGVRQLAEAGLGLAQIPAYVLLWYAFDAFYKLHRPAIAESGQPRPAQPHPAASGHAAEQS